MTEMSTKSRGIDGERGTNVEDVTVKEEEV
jgi:hypothetical protein